MPSGSVARDLGRMLLKPVRMFASPERRGVPCVRLLLVVVAIGSSSSATAQAEDSLSGTLTEREDVAAVTQPLPWRAPSFDAFLPDPPGVSGFTGGRMNDGVSVTVGSDHVFIGSEKNNAIYAYDPLSLAYQYRIATPSPRGVAMYRGELYAASQHDMAIYVYTPGGQPVRRLDLCALDLCDAIGQDTTARPLDGPIEGISVAWHEVWISGPFGVVIVDSQTGALKHVELGESKPVYDDFCNCTPYPGTDVTVVPEADVAITSGLRILQRNPIFGSLIVTSASGGLSNDATGADSVWGMHWLLTTYETHVDEYSVDVQAPAVDGEPPKVTLARQGDWQLRDGCPNCSAQSGDVTYQKREPRIDWSGDLRSSDWMRGIRCLSYIVSDADVYAASYRAQRWLEPARNFDRIDLSIDGTVRASSTSPSGQLCLNTDALSNGTHSLTLQAVISGAVTATASNPGLRLDHLAPSASTAPLPSYVAGSTPVSGSASDAHAGIARVRAEYAPTSAATWEPVCDQAASSLSCSWSTTALPDGPYRLRLVADDSVQTGLGGPNEALSPEVTTTVDNTAPSVDVSGSLADAADLQPLFGGEVASAHLIAHDAGSGSTHVTITIDGDIKKSADAPCSGGACDLSLDYDLDPTTLADGRHTLTVSASDAVGNSTQRSWEIETEVVVTPPGEPEDGPNTSAKASFSDSALPPAPTVATPDLLPCNTADLSPGFTVYDVGDQFGGMSNTAQLRQCDSPYPGEIARANFVSRIYGSCDPDPQADDTSCVPPLEVQTWPACERSLADYSAGPDLGDLDHENLTVRGVPAAYFNDGGARLEIYAGTSTVVIFADARDTALSAAGVLRQISSGGLPSLGTAFGNLPAPAPGATTGHLACIG
jgi:hypothetical protein